MESPDASRRHPTDSRRAASSHGEGGVPGPFRRMRSLRSRCTPLLSGPRLDLAPPVTDREAADVSAAFTFTVCMLPVADEDQIAG